MIIILFCITISMTSLSALQCGDQELRPTIRLIENNDSKILNENFVKLCEGSYSFVKVPYENASYLKTLEIAKPSNIPTINLYTTDYIWAPHNIPSSDISIKYLGDTYDDDEQIVCNITLNTTTCFRNTSNGDIKNKVGAKIVTTNVPEELQDFITTIHFSKGEFKSRPTCEGNVERHDTFGHYGISDPTVLICTYEIDCAYIHNLGFTLECISMEHCTDYIEKKENNLIAVLAPKPFNVDSEFLVPTIFYETPYMSETWLSAFPNSLNLVSPRLMRYALTNFLEHMQWTRIAVISDDSAESINFDQYLEEYFYAKGILYNIQRCEKRHCDFSQSLNNLMEKNAVIIIVNVAQENLLSFCHSMRANANSKTFTYIFREKPASDIVFTYEKTGIFQRAFFITLEPAREENPCNNYYRTENSRILINSIFKGLKIITDTYDNNYYAIIGDSKRKFFRYIAEFMKSKPTHMDVTAIVSQIRITFMKITMDESGYAKDIKLENSPNWPIFQYRENDMCLGKTSKFENPCDYSLILMFMFIAIVFAITLLMIMCYFDSTSPIHATSYQQL